MEDKAPVISFAEEVKKRTGVTLDEEKIAKGTPQPPERVRVDPEQDRVVRLAMDLLSIVNASKVNEYPVAIIAALQVVSNTLSEEFIKTLGREEASKAVMAATTISQQYKPEFDNEPKEEDGSMDTDPEDIS